MTDEERARAWLDEWHWLTRVERHEQGVNMLAALLRAVRAEEREAAYRQAMTHATTLHQTGLHEGAVCVQSFGESIRARGQR